MQMMSLHDVSDKVKK